LAAILPTANTLIGVMVVVSLLAHLY